MAWGRSIFVAVVCVASYFILLKDEKLTGGKILLGTGDYSFKILDAPVAHSEWLKTLAYVASGSSFGPTIRRFLLNNNNIILLRELASQIKLPPLYYPLRRLTSNERLKHEHDNNGLSDLWQSYRLDDHAYEEVQKRKLLKFQDNKLDERKHGVDDHHEHTEQCNHPSHSHDHGKDHVHEHDEHSHDHAHSPGDHNHVRDDEHDHSHSEAHNHGHGHDGNDKHDHAAEHKLDDNVDHHHDDEHEHSHGRAHTNHDHDGHNHDEHEHKTAAVKQAAKKQSHNHNDKHKSHDHLHGHSHDHSHSHGGHKHDKHDHSHSHGHNHGGHNHDHHGHSHGVVKPKKTHTGPQIQRSVDDYVHFYKHGGLPSDVVRNTLNTINEWEREGFSVFASFQPYDAMIQAKASDKRHKMNKTISVLDGVPIAIKDMMKVKGHKIYEGRKPVINGVVYEVADKDDAIVARLRSLGAIILGTTIMTEGGFSPFGYNTHFQGPYNPYSNSRYSGGSSSGSAVAVATGLVPLAIGFDGGGSIRFPAAMCGIHGLAPTFGRISFDNEVAEDTMIKAGPMAGNAKDTALLYSVMAPSYEKNKKSPHFYSKLYDGGNQGLPSPHLTGFTNVDDLSDVRIGIFAEWFNDSDPLITKASWKAVDYLKQKGATIVSITIPHMSQLSLAHGIKISAEFASHWDALYSNEGTYKSLEENSKILLSIGKTSSAIELLAVEKIRHYIFNYMTELFDREKLTCIVTPTTSVPVPSLLAHIKTHGESNTALTMQLMKYVFIANFVGLPAYSVPVGYVSVVKNAEELEDKTLSEGDHIALPVGLQLIGNHWEEHNLLRIAHSIEVGYDTYIDVITTTTAVENGKKKVKHPRMTHYHDPLTIEDDDE